MDNFLKLIGNCSVVMGIISCFYLIVMPFLQKKYTSKWLYYIWLLVIVGWIVPVRPSIVVSLPFSGGKTLLESNNYLLYNDRLNVVSDMSTKSATPNQGISIWMILMTIWLAGVVGIILYHLIKHFRFIRMVSRWGETISEPELLSAFGEAKEQIGVEKDVRFILFPYINTPMMCGVFHHSILLPTKDYKKDEIRLILMHEFIHIRRNDIWYKLLIMSASILHWFNPVIYIVAHNVTMQCELSCDEHLVEQMGFGGRKEYGMTLIHAARKGINLHSALAIDLLKSGKGLKRRIACVMDMTQKKKGLLFLCIVLLLIGNSGVVYGFTNENARKTTQKISFHVDHLKKGNIVCFKGPYKLKKGDIIRWDVSEDDDRFLFIDAIKCSSMKKGVCIEDQNLDGYFMKYPQREVEVTQEDMEGDYCFFVKNSGLDAGSNLEGTIEIIR